MNRVTPMNDRFLGLFIAATLPSLSFAQGPQDYQCTYGGLQRRIEILYETAVNVPCEVHYFKDTEAPDERQVLWRALNESGYCEKKTEEFIAKLREWGWDCGHSADSEKVAEPETVDDTEALMPAENTESTDEQ